IKAVSCGSANIRGSATIISIISFSGSTAATTMGLVGQREATEPKSDNDKVEQLVMDGVGGRRGWAPSPPPTITATNRHTLSHTLICIVVTGLVTGPALDSRRSERKEKLNPNRL